MDLMQLAVIGVFGWFCWKGYQETKDGIALRDSSKAAHGITRTVSFILAALFIIFIPNEMTSQIVQALKEDTFKTIALLFLSTFLFQVVLFLVVKAIFYKKWGK